jgi:class 3 adenylate cyclase
VFLDVTSAHVLWQRAPEAMVETMLLYNELVRALAVRHHGHETMVGDRGNSEGSMCLLFNDPEAACMMCFDLQKELLELCWPKKLLAVPQAQEVIDPVTENVIFRGPRVRCGIHVGRIAAKRGNDIRKAGLKHSGPAIEAAMKLASVAKPGQIVISANVRNRLIESGLVKKKKSKADNGDQSGGKKSDDAKSIKTNFLRKVELPISAPRASGSYAAEDVRSSEDRTGRERRDSDLADVKAFEMKVPGLYRFYANEGADDSENSERDGSSSQQVQVARQGRGMALEGDAETWLNSANMCPWIIDYSKVTVYDDKPLGSGSYGVVYRGKWQNVDIAVKRFIKQTMNERHILEFRYALPATIDNQRQQSRQTTIISCQPTALLTCVASFFLYRRSEMSILSGLHHPNIITFVGACVVEPNLCIITEYMKNGNLRHILSSSVKLGFNDRMRMLLHTAQGLQYLHDTVSPSIIHRDLKCSNILVDETNGVWTVKIADFGFARVKETNTTMTRCGTPSWIAPEIIRGEKYTEKADIYR